MSDVPGTTTDPVRKRVELPHGIGPAVLVDTAGLDDGSLLGPQRRRMTQGVIDSTDIAVVLGDGEAVDSLIETLRLSSIPIVRYHKGESVDSLLVRIASSLPRCGERFLTGDLVKAGQRVILVMPQDSEAPKGRLILPQVQVIRELLDRGCIPVCCTPETLAETLSIKASLVITDSQVFKEVDRTVPKDIPLTSFSILLAGAKGDLKVFVEGSQAIENLRDGDRVLIAEACTHVPDTEDIGRVKIPALLRKRAAVHVDICAGNDFPEDLSPYSLIIHCGGCVASSTLLRSRTGKALHQGVPITNYGIAIARLQGILGRVSLP